MSDKEKREATPEETEDALLRNYEQWNLMNPGFEKDVSYWREKQSEAEQEGYKSEVCECGTLFLAFHHFCRCEEPECPMSDGVSLLDRMTK